MKSTPTHPTPSHARQEDELITLSEVAEILMASENTVRRWQTGGAPEFFKIGRRLYTTAGELRRAESASSAWPRIPSPVDRRRCDRHGRPRNVFLCAKEVMARYGRGKTKGYENVKDRQKVPRP